MDSPTHGAASSVPTNNRPTSTTINMSEMKTKSGTPSREDEENCPQLFNEHLWAAVRVVLGIRTPTSPGPPITSRVLRVCTFVSALSLFLTNLIYSGYNTVSDNSRNDVLDGLVSIMVVSFFCFIGIYSQKLAHRLYTHKMICSMMQYRLELRGKVFLLLILFLLGSFMFILNLSTVNFMYSLRLGKHQKDPRNATDILVNYSDPSIYDPTFDTIFNGPSVNPCKLVILQVEDCQIFWTSQVIFSLFFLMWSFLVVVVLVVTSQKIEFDLRSFIQILQDDGDHIKMELEGSKSGGPSLPWLTRQSLLWWRPTPRRRVQGHLEQSGLVELDKVFGQSCELNGHFVERLTKPLEENELLARYWHLTNTTRLISLALQKWMGSVLCFVGTWGTIRAAYWFSSAPTVIGVCMFVLPLMLIPALTAPYARVTYTASLVQGYIFPTEDRTNMFQYLALHPITMTVYGHQISYSSLGTVIGGILVAFASKIVMEQLSF